MIPQKDLDYLWGVAVEVTQRPGAKAQITLRYKKLAAQYGVEEAREAIATILGMALLAYPGDADLDFLLWRYIPGGEYSREWCDRLFAWYSNDLLMAEAIPLEVKRDRTFVSLHGFAGDREYWAQQGFAVAVALPYLLSDRYLLVTRTIAELGYFEAAEIPLQREPDLKAWVVFWNCKDWGFWMAYKWWPNCQDWYREKHPEWFEECVK